jgi:hypothetical protein
MAWRLTDAPDTLPFAQQVNSWMERFWKDKECPACGENDWRPEGRVFFLQRMMPVEDPPNGLGIVQGVGRDVFPVVCLGCGYSMLIGATIAGIHHSPIPGDLQGLSNAPDPEDEATA